MVQTGVLGMPILTFPIWNWDATSSSWSSYMKLTLSAGHRRTVFYLMEHLIDNGLFSVIVVSPALLPQEDL